MALVSYSDSDNSTGDPKHKIKGKSGAKCAVQSLKRKMVDAEGSTLPPLPDAFHDLYPSAKRKSNQDDPSLHAGRQRLTPHVEGSWPTHVYLEWHPAKEETERLVTVLAEMNHHQPSQECPIPVHSLVRSELGEALPLHISLSRPITLATHERQTFIDRVTSEVGSLSVRPFDILTYGLDWVANNEKTRWFLAMRMKKPPNDELNRLLRVTNRVVTAFGQSPLYGQPEWKARGSTAARRGSTIFGKKRQQARNDRRLEESPLQSSPNFDMSLNFHISIGWALSTPSEESSTIKADNPFPEFRFTVKALKLKIGNSVTSIPFHSRTEATNGIFEA